MVAKVSNMLKTVKNVEDEAGRGVRSLENTIDSIEADLTEYLSERPPKVDAGPEDLIRSTKVSLNGRSFRNESLSLTNAVGYNTGLSQGSSSW